MRILTANGKKIKKINSIMYKDEYYSKRDDCVKIGGKYYPLVHPDLEIDQETGELNLRQRMIEGIVSFDKNKPIKGYFTQNNSKNVICYVDKTVVTMAISENIIPSNYVENLSTGEFWNPDVLTSGDRNYLLTPRTITSHTGKGYNIEDNVNEYKEKIQSYNNNNENIPKITKRLGRLLGDLTFGIENEVSVGSIPERILKKRGVVLCRDGSTNGGEFVSVPMQGPKGVHNIKLLAQEMNKRTVTDINCSYHVHIGNIEDMKGSGKRVFLLALYKLVELIQDELFTMLPYYKTYWKNIKKKDYNHKLEFLYPIYEPNYRIKNFKQYVSYNYAKLFRSLSNNYLPGKRFNSKQKKHPAGESKWNITARLTK